MSLFMLVNYKVLLKAGVHVTLEVYGEEELAHIARILGRSGIDFDVAADHNTGTRDDS